MKTLFIVLSVLFCYALNDANAQIALQLTTIEEGETIRGLIINNTAPEIITTSWQEPSDEKIFVLGEIPEIVRFTSCYRHASCWMEPAIGSQISELPVETQYLLGDLGNGRYVMLIPLVDDHFRSSLQGTSKNELVVQELQKLLEKHAEELDENIRPAAFVEDPDPLVTMEMCDNLPTLEEYLNKN